MSYVEGFVLAVPRAKLEEYKDLERRSIELWMEHGALACVASVGDDTPYGELTSFPRAVQAKDDEVVVLSWIVYADKDSREAVNAKVMEDPRLGGDGPPPFDGKRMIFGGFIPFIER
jgi:uncharacterized protein YbaA (DUF1428 family)